MNDDYEYIIVDGGSTDGTLETIKKYEEIFPIIKYISESDSGIYNAMNKGIEMAEGDYVLFLGAGDIFYNSGVLELVSKKRGYDIIYGYGFFFTGAQVGKKIGCRLTKWGIFWDHCVAHQATYAKLELLKEYPFNERYQVYADQDFLIHMYKLKKSFYYMDKPLCYYDGTGFSSQESNQKKYLDDHLRIMKQYYPVMFFFRILSRRIMHISKKVLQILDNGDNDE